jgi:hypothetical protein
MKKSKIKITLDLGVEDEERNKRKYEKKNEKEVRWCSCTVHAAKT